MCMEDIKGGHPQKEKKGSVKDFFGTVRFSLLSLMNFFTGMRTLTVFGGFQYTSCPSTLRCSGKAKTCRCCRWGIDFLIYSVKIKGKNSAKEVQNQKERVLVANRNGLGSKRKMEKRGGKGAEEGVLQQNFCL